MHTFFLEGRFLQLIFDSKIKTVLIILDHEKAKNSIFDLLNVLLKFLESIFGHSLGWNAAFGPPGVSGMCMKKSM